MQGVRIEKGEYVVKIMKKVSIVVVEISEVMIDTCHRLGKRQDPDIIVKL